MTNYKNLILEFGGQTLLVDFKFEVCVVFVNKVVSLFFVIILKLVSASFLLISSKTNFHN